jgi:hypothetical protein
MGIGILAFCCMVMYGLQGCWIYDQDTDFIR